MIAYRQKHSKTVSLSFMHQVSNNYAELDFIFPLRPTVKLCV